VRVRDIGPGHIEADVALAGRTDETLFNERARGARLRREAEILGDHVLHTSGFALLDHILCGGEIVRQRLLTENVQAPFEGHGRDFVMDGWRGHVQQEIGRRLLESFMQRRVNQVGGHAMVGNRALAAGLGRLDDGSDLGIDMLVDFTDPLKAAMTEAGDNAFRLLFHVAWLYRFSVINLSCYHSQDKEKEAVILNAAPAQ